MNGGDQDASRAQTLREIEQREGGRRPASMSEDLGPGLALAELEKGRLQDKLRRLESRGWVTLMVGAARFTVQLSEGDSTEALVNAVAVADAEGLKISADHTPTEPPEDVAW